MTATAAATAGGQVSSQGIGLPPHACPPAPLLLDPLVGRRLVHLLFEAGAELQPAAVLEALLQPVD